MSKIEELKQAYDELMAHSQAELKLRHYEEAEYFFTEAQKVAEEWDNLPEPPTEEERKRFLTEIEEASKPTDDDLPF